MHVKVQILTRHNYDGNKNLHIKNVFPYESTPIVNKAIGKLTP